MPLITISKELKKELDKLKHFPNESYDVIIKDLVDDRKTLSKKTLKDIEKAKKDIKEGKFYTLEQVKAKMRCKS